MTPRRILPRLSFRTTTRQVRAATAVAGRPAWGAGLRAAVATFVPLLAAQLLHLPPEAGTWMSLAGFSGALVDKGGAPYSTRATWIAVYVACAAVAVALAAVVQQPIALAVATMFVVAVAASLARALGNSGASIGGAVLSTFVIALAIPSAGPGDPLARALYVLAGGAWVMTLALGLWPLRPFRPARRAVADCFDAVAAYADEVRDALAPDAPEGTHVPSGSAAVRAAFEQARATLATIRRGTAGQSRRGERLLVLRESADQLFGSLMALADVVEGIPRADRLPEAQQVILRGLRDMRAAFDDLSAGVDSERESRAPEVRWNGAALRDAVDARHPGVAIAAQYEHAAILLDRLAQFAGVAGANVAALSGDNAPEPDAASVSEVEEVAEHRPILASLRAALDHDSLVLRYALRVGIVTAVAVIATAMLHIERGYWVTITAIVILQPYTGATTIKALQRVLGTILGGVLTAALGAMLHDPRWILLLSFTFAGICVALLPLNYAAYSVFLTPTFVLLAEVSAGDWHLAQLRVLDTLLGGALALAGSRLLWPRAEWSRLPAYAAAVLRADGEYLRVVTDHFADRGELAARAMREARRRAGLATINAEESFQRLMGEHRGSVEQLSPLMTFVTYARRFGASVTALASSRHAVDPATAELLAQFTTRSVALLDRAAAALEGEGAGEPPSTAEAEGILRELPWRDPVVHARLVRLSRQLQVLLEGAAHVARERAA